MPLENQELKRILSAIRKAVIAEVSKQYSVPAHIIWVREVATCIRQSFYNRIYYRNFDEKLAFILLRGRILHEFILEKLPLGIAEPNIQPMEVRLNNEVILRGRADWIVGDYVIDLKYKVYLPKEVSLHDKNQVLLYMYLYGKPKGLVLYINQYGEIRPFIIPRDETLIKYLLDKAVKLYKALVRNCPPEPEVAEWCNWCPWANNNFCPEGSRYVQKYRRREEAFYEEGSEDMFVINIKKRLIDATGLRNIVVRTGYLVGEDYRVEYDNKTRRWIITLYEGLRDPRKEGLLEEIIEEIIKRLKIRAYTKWINTR